MSEDEMRRGNAEEETDEVEAHGHGKYAANTEAGDEAEAKGDDDVEAHGHGKYA